jgi:osmotically-inducible protein OsmY
MIVTASRFTIALAALSTVVLFSTCRGSAEQRAMAQGDKKPIGLGSTKSANTDLEEEISAKLASDDRLKAAKLSVSADVTKNQITLSGILPSDTLRARAVELAKSAQAGVIVNDQITVKARAANALPER